MKKEQVIIGAVYIALVNKSVGPIRVLDNDHIRERGWIAVNLATGHKCKVKSAGRFRRVATQEEIEAALRRCFLTHGNVGASREFEDFRQLETQWLQEAVVPRTDSA